MNCSVLMTLGVGSLFLTSVLQKTTRQAINIITCIPKIPTPLR